jgi:autotransporter-associated beta strand protein
MPPFTGLGALVFAPGTNAVFGAADFSGDLGAVLSGSSTLTKVGKGTVALLSPSAFTGKTIIQEGALSVSTLNRVSGGTALSTLGAPTTAANGTIDLGSLTASGTLIVTGSSQTSDRVINLSAGPANATPLR